MEGHGFPAGSGPWRSCPEPGLRPRRHWQVSSRHHQTRTLDYGYLLGLLEDLQAHWEEAGSLPQEQVGSHENAPGGCARGCSGWDKQGQDRQSPALLGCTACGSGRGLKTSGQSAGIRRELLLCRPRTGLCDTKGESLGRRAVRLQPCEQRREWAAWKEAQLVLRRPWGLLSPGGAVEAREGTRARPVGLEARSREGALQGRALQTGCFCRGAGTQQSVLKGPVPQEEGLADSFSAFSEFGLQLLRQLRDYFPASNSTAVYRLELLLKWVQPLICQWGLGPGGCSRLPGVGWGWGDWVGHPPVSCNPSPRCLGKLQIFQPSFEICPFETELNMDIAAALKVHLVAGSGLTAHPCLCPCPRAGPVEPHTLALLPSHPTCFLGGFPCREATVNGLTGS